MVKSKLKHRKILRYINHFKSFNDMDLETLRQYSSLGVCLMHINNLKICRYVFDDEFCNKLLDTILKKIQNHIGKSGHVYLYKEDILMLILFDIKLKSEIACIIEKILKGFNKIILVNNQEVRILLNIGISIYPQDNEKFETVFKFAEIAMNNSKNFYRNEYKFFESEMYENIIKNWKLNKDILKAIEKNEFILYYQPQVNNKTNKIYGMEALIRWNHSKYGILSPAFFIDIVEKNGTINEIGKLVFKEACRKIKELKEFGYPKLIMSVNISERQLEDVAFLDFVKNTLIEEEVKAEQINMEITERILVKPTENILNVLTELRKIGIKIYIDDFGTKYSSLNYIYSMPIDGIKLDKIFIDRIHNSKKDKILTKNIIKLAGEICLDVVAEGVEKEEQLDCLISMDCHKIQGYIFSKPVDFHDLKDYLLKFDFNKII